MMIVCSYRSYEFKTCLSLYFSFLGNNICIYTSYLSKEKKLTKNENTVSKLLGTYQ